MCIKYHVSYHIIPYHISYHIILCIIYPITYSTSKINACKGNLFAVLVHQSTLHVQAMFYGHTTCMYATATTTYNVT